MHFPCSFTNMILPHRRPNINLNLAHSHLILTRILYLFSNLSLRTALPRRSYDVPRSADARAKVHFVQTVRRYFYQLTEGCGDDDCDNRFEV